MDNKYHCENCGVEISKDTYVYNAGECHQCTLKDQKLSHINEGWLVEKEESDEGIQGPIG